MNGDPVSRESLKNFYGYKETFGRNSVWVPVPQELTFITTNNPYDDEDVSGNLGVGHVDDGMGHNGMTFDPGRDASDGDFARQLAQAAYPAYATHGLEALSAVASQDQYNYAPPPPAPMGTHDGTPVLSHNASPQQSHETISQSLESLLNVHATQPAITSPPPNIDPRLQTVDPTQQQPEHHQQHQQGQHQQEPHQQEQQPHPQQQMQPQLHHDQPISVRTPPSYNPVRPPSLLSKGTTGGGPAIRDPELAFLIRDYSEHAGVWMDLFDLGQFFATEVPVWAAGCPLLLYSCAALSAKSLSRIVDGEVDTQLNRSSRHSRLASWPGVPLDAEGWVRKGRENYDVAVSLLRQALAGVSTAQSYSLPDDTTEETASVAQGTPLPSPDSVNLVAATAVLCVYEFLDASGAEWSRHLDGAKSLFDVAKEKAVPLAREGVVSSGNAGDGTLSATTTPQDDIHVPQNDDSLPTIANQVRERLASDAHTLSTSTIPPEFPSKGRTAVFWNFARQDMLSAFINNTSTRLDTSDLPMWVSAGLNLTLQGHLCPSNTSHPAYDSATAMSDDTISNALIWLTMKLVNFIAAGDEMPESTLGVRQHDLLAYWHEMDQQFRSWYDGLPPSFRAISIGTSDTNNTSITNNDDSTTSERWFPRPMCASAMQTYHFARVQLLHNKPHTSTGSPFSPGPSPFKPARSSIPDTSTPGSSLAARHASYASILQQGRFHAREIIAISCGHGGAKGDEAARIHSVQPLWTAGLVLGAADGAADGGGEEGGVGVEASLWRREIVELLRGVESDTGWAAEYRVRDLLEIWGEESSKGR